MLGPSPAARALLERARAVPLSYEVRAVRAPDDRCVVILGEAHLKFAAASALGRELVSAFELRGVETFQTERVFGGRALWVLIHVPRLLLRAASLGLIKGSTITDAKALRRGHTFELESVSTIPVALHVGAVYLGALFFVFWSLLLLSLVDAPAYLLTPFAWVNYAFQLHLFLLIPAILLRRYAWSTWLHPAVAILTVRDSIMAEGTVAMLADHPGTEPAIVVMGRAHSAGYERELIQRFGFTHINLFEHGES